MLTRLLQLTSPALPVGAYSFSEGLEQAVEAGWVSSEAQTLSWVQGVLTHTFGRLDVPLFARLYAAWQRSDRTEAVRHSAWLLANRETAELRGSDRAMGKALARVLVGLGVAEADPSQHDEHCTYACMFALGCVSFGIDRQDGAQALAWAWAESQIAAAIKLVPLGQSAGQRCLFALGAAIPAVCAQGIGLDDDQVGGAAMGLAIASARHETQYTRLFRS